MEGVVLLTSYALSPVISEHAGGTSQPGVGRHHTDGRQLLRGALLTPFCAWGPEARSRMQERAVRQPNASREAWARGRDRPHCPATLQTQQGAFPGPVWQGSVKNCSCFCS